MAREDSSGSTPSPKSHVEALMEITADGFYCRIRYRKGGKEGVTERVIEPRQLTDGPCGMMVRAVQIEPESGLRSFSVHKILRVERDARELPLNARKGNNFCTGEIVAFTARRSSEKPRLTRSEGAPSEADTAGPLWSQRWFISYIGIVREALLDLSIDNDDRITARSAQQSLGLTIDNIRAAHSFILAEELLSISADGRTDEREDERIRCLIACLGSLGWAPIA